MTPTLTFVCSICGEPSRMICVYCTKDACGNHLCERCHRCSDCCECEVRLEERLDHEPPVFEQVPEPVLAEIASMDEPALEPDIIVESAVVEEVVTPEPAVEEEPAAAEPEPTVVDEQISAPEPEMPPPPPAPLQPHPDLSKLFAPEDAPPRVFPTSHGPVPISNNPPEDSPGADDNSEEEQG